MNNRSSSEKAAGSNAGRWPRVFLVVSAVLAFLALAAAALGTSGCGGGSEEGMVEPEVPFPEFVYRSQESLEGYRIAVTYPVTLEFVPCYCGCQQDAEKYRSLKDCFINRQTGEYDEHAAGCTTCLDEALDIKQWKQEGLSDRQIRDRIDEKYAERGEPTDTPMPPE